jgi:hypothetical protein
MLEQKKLSLAMQRLASEHPGLVSVLNVGHSRSGRMFEALRIAAGELTPGRPAILIVANIEGPEVYTSGVALGLARSLAEGYLRESEISTLLDSTTIYLVPRANPDGAEARFLKPMMELRGTGHGVDNDRDGRSGEDGPADVDGDGMVSWMRILDPEGEWIEDPTDARAMIRAERAKGQRGRWKLTLEGRDSDGDEEVCEDPERDARVNRNFPQDFVEHDPESGLFATDEPETRALCEFVMARKDIQLVLVWGELDNLVAKSKGIEPKEGGRRGGGDRVPPSGTLQEDHELIEELGRRYGKVTQDPPEGATEWAGSFQAWCYAQRGLLTLSARLWSIPTDEESAGKSGSEEAEGDASGAGTGAETEADAPEQVAEGSKETAAKGRKGKGGRKQDEDEPKPAEDAMRLAWIDAHPEEGAGRFLPWTPFAHPELGPVEIGGFAPYATLEPPVARRIEIVSEQLQFLVKLGESLARVRIVDAKIRELGPGLIEARAVLQNESLLPLITAAGRRARALRPARVEIHLPR